MNRTFKKKIDFIQLNLISNYFFFTPMIKTLRHHNNKHTNLNLN